MVVVRAAMVSGNVRITEEDVVMCIVALPLGVIIRLTNSYAKMEI